MSESYKPLLTNCQKVLITGGTGLIGSNLIERLVSEGIQIRATVHNKEPIIVNSEIEYVNCDLTNASDCQKAMENISHVFHCAANTSGAATMATTPMVHVTPNLIMNTLILDAAYQAGVNKFLWLSSTTGYPPTGTDPVTEDQMFEDDPYSSYYFVGWMKRFTEILCKMYGERLQHRMTTIVLRPSNVYGPNDDFEFATSHVIPALIRKTVERWDPLEVWGTGHDLRDVIYVDDMVDAMLMAMDHIDSYSAFNIGFGKAYSVREILGLILEIDGYQNARVTYDSSKPSMIPARFVNTNKATESLNFNASTHLRTGLEKTIRWYRKYSCQSKQG